MDISSSPAQRDGADTSRPSVTFARGAAADGKFVRLRTTGAGQKTFQGDYLGLTENHAIVKMLLKQGAFHHLIVRVCVSGVPFKRFTSLTWSIIQPCQ